MTIMMQSTQTNQQFVCRSGRNYLSDTAGNIPIVQNSDLIDMMGMGCTVADSGLPTRFLPMFNARNPDGTSPLVSLLIPTAFTINLTPGSILQALGAAAQGNTKASTLVFEYILPITYNAGTAITITANAKYSGSGTAGTRTIGATLYKVNVDGTQTANQIITAAQNITTANADYAFMASGSSLQPGDRVLIGITTTLQETGVIQSLTAALNSVRLS